MRRNFTYLSRNYKYLIQLCRFLKRQVTNTTRRIVTKTGIAITRNTIQPDTELSFVIINVTFLLRGDGPLPNTAPKIGDLLFVPPATLLVPPPGIGGRS